MVVRLKEPDLKLTAGDGIDISENNVISVLLRATNNLIHVNDDRELYVDLQLDDGIEPTDDFPVWVTTGKILAEDGRPQNGLILNWKTTSWDYARLIYAQDWKLYLDPGTWVWQEIWAWGGGTCDCNVKLFTISWAADLTNAQAALDWQKSGKDAIISYNNEIYMFKAYKVVSQTPAVWLSYNHIVRDWLSDGYSETYASAIEINYNTSNDTVTSISFATYKTTPSAISPDTYYASPFIPTQSYHPASKAYVDQMVSWVYIYQGSVATYADLANIQNPRVWDVYNVIDTWMNYAWTWTAWDELWWTVNFTAWDWIWINNWVISNTKPWATVSSTAPSNPSEWDLWYDTTNDVLKSYDGTSWVETGTDAKIKYFYIHNPNMYQQDAIADVQAIWDYIHGGAWRWMVANCIDGFLTNIEYDVWTHVFTLTWWGWSPANSWSDTVMTYVTLTCPTDWNWVVQSVTYSTEDLPFLATDEDYFTPYTPLYAWSPTTKQYVDGKDTYIWSSAPSTPYEWQLWYDTANDVVKSYDGTNWNTIWSGGWGSWDMLYSDFNFVTATGSTVTLSLSTVITPSANFTVNAPSTIKDWQTYILRVTNGATPYTMTLWTGITNPSSASTTLTANSTDQFVFLAVWWNLELQASWWWASYGTATSSTEWVIKLWSDTVQSVAANSPSSTASRTYPVQLNSSGQAVVNVPWTDSWGGWGWSYSAWNWIDITNSVISNTMYPSNQATGSAGDILMKTANGTEWLTSDWIYTNVKCWDITNASSSTRQAIVQRVEKWSNYSAILNNKTVPTVYVYGEKTTVGSTTTYIFPCVENAKNASSVSWPSTWYTTIYNSAYKIEVTGSTYTGSVMDNRQTLANVIEPTGVPYTWYFTPTQDYHPATKKYVDDAVAWWGGWWITNNTTGTTSTVTQIWAGTELEYQALSNPSASILYFTF